MTELDRHSGQRPATRRHEGLYGAEALSALPIEDQIQQLCTALPPETGWHTITEYSGGVLRLGQIRVHTGSGSYELMLRTAFCHQDQRDAPHFPDDEGAEYSFTLVDGELLYRDVTGSSNPLWSEKTQARAQATLVAIGVVYEGHRHEVESTDRAAETMGRVIELYPSGVDNQQDSLLYIAGNKIADALQLCKAIRTDLTEQQAGARAACIQMEAWLKSRTKKPILSLADIQTELSRLLRACDADGFVPDEYFSLKNLLKSSEVDQSSTQAG